MGHLKYHLLISALQDQIPTGEGKKSMGKKSLKCNWTIISYLMH